MDTRSIDHDVERVTRAWLDALELTAGSAELVATYAPVLALTITRETVRVRREVLGACAPQGRSGGIPGCWASRPCGSWAWRTSQGSPSGREKGTVAAWADRSCRPVARRKLAADCALTAGLSPDFVQVWQAHSVIGIAGGQPVTEPLTMINAHLSVPARADIFPSSTTSNRGSALWPRSCTHGPWSGGTPSCCRCPSGARRRSSTGSARRARRRCSRPLPPTRSLLCNRNQLCSAVRIC